jgi:hypothetical protein
MIVPQEVMDCKGYLQPLDHPLLNRSHPREKNPPRKKPRRNIQRGN